MHTNRTITKQKLVEYHKE
uniref:Uncharacterized protein n=1 Tax=Arundo donax TaxID=35708 RepID=A0A0A8ZZL9_ARUDO